jgi:predicted murein hydrolase (TIGR00659 family)
MTNLLNTDLFSLTLTLGAYVVSCILYKKTKVALLHPLIVSIFVIIAILTALGIPYETYKNGSRLVSFLLGPSVVALGYVLFEQMKYLKGNVVSILVSIVVGSVVGILSVAYIAKAMGADASMVATLSPKSVTTPIAMEISEKTGGLPGLTAVVVVMVGIFGSIIGPLVLKAVGIESRIAKGLAMGAAAHGVGTAAAIQIGAIEGAISGLAIGLMGVATAILIPIIGSLNVLFGILN